MGKKILFVKFIKDNFLKNYSVYRILFMMDYGIVEAMRGNRDY